MEIQASWTLDLSDVKDPPDYFYRRVVKYWKGLRYVYFTKHESAYKKMVDAFSKSILEEVDRRVLEEIIEHSRQGDLKTHESDLMVAFRRSQLPPEPVIYCPYIPLMMLEQDLNHGTKKESGTKEEGNNPEG